LPVHIGRLAESRVNTLRQAHRHWSACECMLEETPFRGWCSVRSLACPIRPNSLTHETQ
jgi:hypothetical protein